MLKVENLSTGYGKKQVLFDVSFEVKQGEIVLVIGSNGSGKSTVLKAIYGLMHEFNGSTGKIFFDNEEITNVKTSELIKKGLIYIPQKNNLFEDLTVKENLEISGITIDHKILIQKIEKTLGLFTSLIPLLKRTPMKLSGGERQLLTLAMATLHQPKMIMIDEPFAGLSPQNIEFISDNLKKLNGKNGITLIIVEHRIKECVQIANKVIGLKLGKLFSNLGMRPDSNITELQSIFI